MNTQEELFKKFQLLGKSFQNLGSIVQNAEATVTWQEVEEFDRQLETLTSEMSRLRMPVILYLKDQGLIK